MIDLNLFQEKGERELTKYIKLIKKIYFALEVV